MSAREREQVTHAACDFELQLVNLWRDPIQRAGRELLDWSHAQAGRIGIWLKAPLSRWRPRSRPRSHLRWGVVSRCSSVAEAHELRLETKTFAQAVVRDAHDESPCAQLRHFAGDARARAIAIRDEKALAFRRLRDPLSIHRFERVLFVGSEAADRARQAVSTSAPSELAEQLDLGMNAQLHEHAFDVISHGVGRKVQGRRHFGDAPAHAEQARDL